jgi:hypothetical protein
LLSGRDVQKARKDEQIGKEKPVTYGDEFRPRQARHQRSKRRIDREHAKQRAGEKPRQILHSTGDAHLIADRTQNVIGEKYGKYVKPSPT